MPSSEKLRKCNVFNNSDLRGDLRTPYKKVHRGQNFNKRVLNVTNKSVTEPNGRNLQIEKSD